MWEKEYKGVTIICNEDGYFIANIEGKDYIEVSFQDIKEVIDNQLKKDFTITKKDWQNLINKLSPKETRFISNLVREVNCHSYDPYCNLGITDGFDFDISELQAIRY